MEENIEEKYNLDITPKKNASSIKNIPLKSINKEIIS